MWQGEDDGVDYRREGCRGGGRVKRGRWGGSRGWYTNLIRAKSISIYHQDDLPSKKGSAENRGEKGRGEEKGGGEARRIGEKIIDDARVARHCACTILLL